MSIKGITEEARFPKLGDIRKGAPKPNEKKPGNDLTYFRFTSEEEGLEDLFHALYGERPRRLNIRLPYATTDENLQAWLEEYVAGGLLRRCNGETCVLWRDKNGEMSDAEKKCEKDVCSCKETGRLEVVLPEMERLGTVTVHTTSVHDIRNLYGALKGYEQIARQSGKDLTGIPFVLSRRPRKISTPASNGKRARREKWLLMIEPLPDWVSLQLREAERRALLSTTIDDTHQLEDGEIATEWKTTEQVLTQPDATAIKEAQTVASDYGFNGDRDLRIRLAGLFEGCDIASFKDLSSDQLDHAAECMQFIIEKVSDKNHRLRFAEFATELECELRTPDMIWEALKQYGQSIIAPKQDEEKIQQARVEFAQHEDELPFGK